MSAPQDCPHCGAELEALPGELDLLWCSHCGVLCACCHLDPAECGDVPARGEAPW